MDSSDILKFIQRSKENKGSELDLSNKGLTSLPPEIGELTHLKVLNLSYNNFTDLPETIWNLVNLEKLHLNRNRIDHLPASIGKLCLLKELDLSYNLINILPIEIGQLRNLEQFDASYCEIRFLPVEFTQLTHLKEMNLDENPMLFPPTKVLKRGLYATMHFLTLEKRKFETSRVMLQIFNMPEKIQPAFREYIRYFNQMVSQANSKEVVFDMNFINQDFYQEMVLNAGVENHLNDVMRFIKERSVASGNDRLNIENEAIPLSDVRLQDVKNKLVRFNETLEQKIAEISSLKNEIKGLSELLDG